MKTLLNFLADAWTLFAAVFVSGLFLVLMVQGISQIRPWLWVVMTVISLVAGIAAYASKKPAFFLAVIPILALPLFLAGGIQAKINNFSPTQEEPTNIQNTSRQFLGTFFGK